MSTFSKSNWGALCFFLATGFCLAIGFGHHVVAQEPEQLANSDTIAIVLDVQGNVISASDADTKLKRRDSISEGALNLESGASILLAFPSGGDLQRLVAGDTAVSVSLTATGATETKDLQIKKIPGKIPAGSLAKLSSYTRAGVGQARSEVDPPSPLVTPIHDSLVLVSQPLLSWPETAEVESFKVVIFKSGSMRKVFSGSTAENQITVSKQLEPGKYQWNVTGTAAGNTTKEIAEFMVDGKPVLKSFVVANESQLDDLQQLLGLAETDPPSVGLLEFIAARAKQESAFTEAIQLQEKIRELDPQHVAAQVELYELYRRAGRIADAEQAKLKAEELGFDFELSKK